MDCAAIAARRSLPRASTRFRGRASVSAARKSRTDNTVQSTELRDFLVAFAAERLALIERHEAGARVVSHYDFNNTYQYVIAREDTHLSWVGQALVEMDTPLPKASSTLAVPP